MSGILVSATGERQISLKLETLAPRLHEKLETRINTFLSALWDNIEGVVPHRTGRLASEISSRLFSGAAGRVAGYISVYSPDPGPAPHNEYAKAATLEYGSNKARAVRDDVSGVLRRITGSSRRIKARLSAPVNIAARRYLRGPFDEMRSAMLVAMEEAVVEAVNEDAE